MRENCTYGSEGGEANAFPTPINYTHARNACFSYQEANNWQQKLGPRV
jgi:hypothetical protein